MDKTEQKNEAFGNICSVLQILGAKWSFLVMYELSKGARRFQQLRRELPIIRTQSLTDVLRHLEKCGVVRREVFPTVPVTVEYSLTAKGLDFQAALNEMEKWAARWKDAGQSSDGDSTVETKS
ncbi:winged helix-turn-helix transcriptional regulator [Paenibacillus daejeonensis]|uniref:winged helix-turn-helix transcriptional regulator n=1 Tax=Paenibacillus daejeonensis TaxID=135193 RepID=UPI00036642F7|nr:helix-turn-helix domain-containing protein [Paenibacillus daejeonensis]